MVQRVTQRDWRDDRIDELEKLLKVVLERIANLEERLGTSSQNSSTPPSSDSPKQPADRKNMAAAITKRSSKKRKPGGQPGHKGVLSCAGTARRGGPPSRLYSRELRELCGDAPRT